MAHDFDKGYWEEHWEQGPGATTDAEEIAPHPYLARETAGLTPGTALDAGAGAGAEAIWLAANGWQVTAADISANALARASARAAAASVADRVSWVEADLTRWEPDRQFELVLTSYAHPTMPQLEFYDRIAAWVAPSGTLLIVGHLHGGMHTANGSHPPAETTVTLADVTSRFDPSTWRIETAVERIRSVGGPGQTAFELRDVVVRATRFT